MRRNANKRRGFTLTEILVAMAIFALGGTAIMALFITNVRLSRQAMNYTRAAEITRNVRSLITQSLARPINLRETDNIYEFYYPESSLTFNPNDYHDEEGSQETTSPPPENLGGTPVENTIYFRLPKDNFDARGANLKASKTMIAQLPRDAVNNSGGAMSFANGNPRVFRLLPDKLRQAGALNGLDPDDRMFYQFDFSIRRSVQRSGVDSASGNGGKQPLSDLYVVHIKIYKGFDFEPEVISDPYFEWDFYVNAAQ